jgi:hypothetical protein
LKNGSETALMEELSFFADPGAGKNLNVDPEPWTLDFVGCMLLYENNDEEKIYLKT